MKKFKLRYAFMILILVICAIFIKINSGLIFMDPFSMEYGDIVYATLDQKGNQIILDASGKRLIKVSPASEIDFIVKGDQNSGKGFNEAKKVITDAKDHIYVLNILKEKSGYRIKKEEIIEYSPEGKYLGIICEIEHETPVLVENIVGLYSLEGKLAYIANNEDSFELYNKENELVHSYPLENASQFVVSYGIDSGTQRICYSTRQGKIYEYKESDEDTLLYDAADSEFLSIPREISFDPEGNLYFTDIGLRTVSLLDSEGQLSHVIYDGVVGEDTALKYIYYYCNANNGIITVTSDYTATVESGEIAFGEAPQYSGQLLAMILAVWTACILASMILLFFIIKLLILLITKGAKTIKLAAGVIVGVACISGVFLLIVLPDFENRLLESVLQRAQVVSDVTEMMLPIDEFKSLDSTTDYMSEDYLAVREKINEIFLSDSEGIEGFYCMLYSIQDGIITCTYSLQEDTGAIYPYDWEYEDSDEQEIMTTGQGKVYEGMTSSEGSFLFVLNPIIDENNQTVGLIEVGTDLNSFQKETNRMILELFLHVIVITIVVVLIALEIIIFFHGRSEYLLRKQNKQEGIPVQMPVDILRILVFGIFFITNMTTSFLPLYAMNIAENETVLAIPKEVLAAIPISAEVLFGAIFSIMGNVIIQKLGQKKSALLGSFLLTGGLLIRFIIPNIWILTLGNSIMGSGWGILLLIVNTVIAMGDEEEKNKGFSGYSAAALNGINCGIVFGGFLINWLNHFAIFLLAAVLSLLIVAHVVLYITKITYTGSEAVDEKTAAPINLLQFMTGKGVLGFFLMIVIPVIACGYFLNYMFPILGSEYGLSETKVGYSYLINGLCVICFSEILTKFFSKKVKKAYALVVASLLYAAAFFFVSYFQNIYSLIAAMVLLGLSDGFGLPLQTSYYTDLEAVKKYGYEKSMGIYSLFENTAQAGGSFIFSYVLLIGVKDGLYIVLLVVSGLAIMFGILYFLQGLNQKRKLRSKA